jgi:hypothetical protein
VLRARWEMVQTEEPEPESAAPTIPAVRTPGHVTFAPNAIGSPDLTEDSNWFD